MSTIKTSFTIPMADLLAVAEFASEDRGRPVLQGVSVQPRKSSVSLTATDGRCIASQLSVSEDASPSDGFVIPTVLLKRAPHADKKHRMVKVVLNGRIELHMGDDVPVVAMRPPDLKYPATKQIWNTSKGKGGDPGPIAMDPQLLVKIRRAQRHLGTIERGISFSRTEGKAENPLIIRLHARPSFAVIVMPLAGVYLPGLPAWLFE